MALLAVTHYTIGWNPGSAWLTNLEIPILASFAVSFLIVLMYYKFLIHDLVSAGVVKGYNLDSPLVPGSLEPTAIL